MTPLLLAFAGSIGSGKSTLAQAVGDILGWPVVSFGDYVRRVAVQRGSGESRAALQAVGEALIAEGWPTFCAAVLTQGSWTAGQPLIVDGIRHSEAVETLQRLVTPLPVRLVVIDVAVTTRTARIQNRGREVVADLAQIENHSTEIQVRNRLPQMADLHVDMNDSLDSACRAVLRYLQQSNEP